MHSTIMIRRLVSTLTTLFAVALLSAGAASARDRDSGSHHGARIDPRYEALALVAAFAGGYQLAELFDRHGERNLRHRDRRGQAGDSIQRHSVHRHGHGCGHHVSLWRSLRHHSDYSRGHRSFHHHHRRHTRHNQHDQSGRRRHHDRY